MNTIRGEGDETVRAEERSGGDHAAQHDGRQTSRSTMHPRRQEAAQAWETDHQAERHAAHRRDGMLELQCSHEKANARGGEDGGCDSGVANPPGPVAA